MIIALDDDLELVHDEEPFISENSAQDAEARDTKVYI